MDLPASNNDFIKDTSFSSLPNSDVSLSSLSLSTNDLTAARLKLALSIIGEEAPDDAKMSFTELNFFPELKKIPRKQLRTLCVHGEKSHSITD